MVWVSSWRFTGVSIFFRSPQKPTCRCSTALALRKIIWSSHLLNFQVFFFILVSMKAAIYEKFKESLTIRNVPNPRPTKSGVVVRVKACGICRSDWHGWMGNDRDIVLPHVPGHELAGVVEEVGSEVKNWKRGDRVTVPFVGGCGSCKQCLSGNQQVCDFQFQPGFTAWGAFAEYVAIDYAATNLVLLPEEIDFVTASSLGCRFITSFRAVAHQAKVTGGEWVAVHGCGGVGLSAIMIANALGAKQLQLIFQMKN